MLLGENVMGHARICLLGRFRLIDAAGGDVPLAARKAQQLLAILALSAPQPVRRDRLIGLLWSDMPEERARHSLRQLLSSLRKEMAAVRADGDELSLDLEACDVDVLELRRLATGQSREALTRAVDLYRGPLLEGADSTEWLATERRRLDELAAAAMARLARAHAEAEDLPAAAQVLRRWLEVDPCAEEAYRQLMRTLDAAGDRAGALQLYQRCVDVLQRELGAAPSEATTAIYRGLRDASAQPESPRESGGLPALAVLPVVNLTRDAGLGALCAALGEDLGAHLARLPGFEVLAERAVAVAAQEAGVDIRRLARALRARYLVTGSLRRLDDGGIRIALQLLEAESAQYLWTELTDLAERPAQAALDEFVARISGKLEQRLTLAASRSTGAGPDAPRDAWDALRKGSSALFTRGWSPEAVHDAIRLYREAIALDPEFALARAQKALITSLSARWGILDNADLVAEAHADADTALAMAPNQSEVLGAAGCAIADLGDPERALPLLERAVEENPGNAQAWAALGATQLLLRRLEAGIEALRRGLRTSPTDYRRTVWQTALAGGLARLKSYEQALEVAHAACRSDVNFYPPRIVLAGVLAKLGRDGEAARALAEAKRLRPQLTLQEVRLWAGGRALDKFDGVLTAPRTRA
jgi:DNA-binding SARP family transcriptional activator